MVDVNQATGANDAAPMMLEGRATLRVLGEAEWASNEIGVNTKIGTTQLFGLPEARGVTVAGGEDAKPVPEAAKDEAWAASWLELAGRAETSPELAMPAGKLEGGKGRNHLLDSVGDGGQKGRRCGR